MSVLHSVAGTAKENTDLPNSLRNIRVISDGRPGHENQSTGLALALARRTGAQVETVRLPVPGWVWSRVRAAVAVASSGPIPDLVIGAGHKTHLPLWYAARKFQARSVVIMKPTWPSSMFDICVLPRHDSAPGPRLPRFIVTRGALNRIPEETPPKQPRGLLMIGGPSRYHGWNPDALIEAVRTVTQSRPELEWTLGDSRRTPRKFLESLASLGLAAKLVPHAQTKPDWLPTRLLEAEEVWVTADSVSMVFEAVTSGARTGLLPTPIKRPNASPPRAVAELVRGKLATPFETWLNDGRRLPTPERMHETGRCADFILDRLFPRNVS